MLSDPKPPLLLGQGLIKSFGATRALNGADIEVREREIHGLLGASGAGKSTLAKVIAGHLMFESGEMTYRSYPVRLRNPREALRVGIALVGQESVLAPDLTVLQNMFLPRLGRPEHVPEEALRKRGMDLLASLGQAGALPLDREVYRLTPAQKQLVGIARAFGGRCKLMILDEPTASLSPTEVDRLFNVMTQLRLSGCGLILASHRPDEILSIADRVTVMREGRMVLSGRRAGELDEGQVGLAMGEAGAGRRAADPRARPPAGSAPVAVEVSRLCALPVVEDVSFEVREGEIVGLGGLLGAGRSETLEAILGLRTGTTGSVTLFGQALVRSGPAQALRAGIAFVGDVASGQGGFRNLSVAENLGMAGRSLHRGPWSGGRATKQKIAAVLDRLGLPTDLPLDAPLGSLPESVARKVLLGCALMTDPRVLILDEPTRGADLATRADIHAALHALAGSGVAIVVILADFEELLALSDRVVVISDGRSVADVPSAALDAETLTLLAAPGSFMAGSAALLHDLTRENGGASFRAMIKDEQVICLDAVVTEPEADPGLRPGEIRHLDDTSIPAALRGPRDSFVAEPDGLRATMLVPVLSPRGRDHGWVGLTVPSHADLPPAAAVRFHIDSLMASSNLLASSPPPRHTLLRPSPASLASHVLQRPETWRALLAVLVAVVLAVSCPGFLSRANLFSLVDRSVVIGIVSAGMTFVVLSGGIDLSVGSVAGLTGIILGLALHHLSIPVSIALAVLAGGGIGLLSGLLVRLSGLPAFAVTLGGLAVYRVLAVSLSDQEAVAGIPDRMQGLVYTNLSGIPANLLFLIALYGVAWAGLTHTKGGHTLYAVGSSQRAARAAGLRSALCCILPYGVSGALAAVAVTYSISQIQVAYPLMGAGMELDAIAAVLIGGARLAGGRGSIIGTLIGVLILVMVRNGLALWGVPALSQGLAVGIMLLLALLVDRLTTRRRT